MIERLPTHYRMPVRFVDGIDIRAVSMVRNAAGLRAEPEAMSIRERLGYAWVPRPWVRRLQRQARPLVLRARTAVSAACEAWRTAR